MTWLTIICIVIIVVLLLAALPIELRREIVEARNSPSVNKRKFFKQYGVSSHTYIKWMDVMMPELWFQIKPDRKVSGITALAIKWMLGEQYNGLMVVTRDDLRRELNLKSGKELSVFMEKYSERLGLSVDTWKTFNCYPPSVLEGAVFIRNRE